MGKLDHIKIEMGDTISFQTDNEVMLMTITRIKPTRDSGDVLSFACISVIHHNGEWQIKMGDRDLNPGENHAF